jgi:hypothetical protein
MLKDANLIQQFSESLSSPVPALHVVERNLKNAVALGFGNENASAVIKALEKEADVEVTRKNIDEHRRDIGPRISGNSVVL